LAPIAAFVREKKAEVEVFYSQFLEFKLDPASFDLQEDPVFQFSSLAVTLYDINVIYYFFKDNLQLFGLS